MGLTALPWSRTSHALFDFSTDRAKNDQGNSPRKRNRLSTSFLSLQHHQVAPGLAGHAILKWEISGVMQAFMGTSASAPASGPARAPLPTIG